MLFRKHLENLFAAFAAEGVGFVCRGDGECPMAKREGTKVTEGCGGFHLLAGAEGFDIGDDPPTVQGIDGGRKGRLPSFRNAVADFFEKGPF
jgi:hypothetical protein